MNYAFAPSLAPGTDISVHLDKRPVFGSIEPPPFSLAQVQIERMMEDSDIRSLPEPVRRSLRQYSVEVARSFPLTPSTGLALFGDVEEGVGEIILVDREADCQVDFTVSAGAAAVWMRGPSNKERFESVSLEHVSLLAVMFQQLR